MHDIIMTLTRNYLSNVVASDSEMLQCNRVVHYLLILEVLKPDRLIMEASILLLVDSLKLTSSAS